MRFLMDTIKGMLIGIANIIPGVSGGTMAVSLGIYDRLIGSISDLPRHPKKSASVLLPIILGCGIGIVGFTYVIEYLLSRHTFVTCMAFTGLILGGLPVLYGSLKKELAKGSGKISLPGILAFLVLFGVAVFLPMMNADDEVLRTFTPSFGTMAALFFVGVIASATMVVPGVSGSLVMMILGYYYGIINTIKSFLDALRAFDTAGLVQGFALLAPFGIGVLLGIFLIAKLITFLFKRFGVQTYCAIFGLIIASPFAIFYNTGALTQSSFPSIGQMILGLILAAGCGFVTWKMGD